MEELWFDQFVTIPGELSTEHYDQLTTTLCKYPYFQLLILTKLQFVKKHLPEQYSNLLRHYTVAISNHKHMLLFMSRLSKPLESEVINGIISERQSVIPNETSFPIEQPQTQTTSFTLVEEPTTVTAKIITASIPNEEIMNRTDEDLIDRFIREQPSMPRLDARETECRTFTNKEVESEDELFSETLAKIYLKQGLYDKAITTYIKLSLKFPEKSVYFANRIEIIKEKINN